MVVVPLRYHFRQAFRVPARAAYEWCTDFGPHDGPLFSERTARSVRWLCNDALVMTDTTYPEGRALRIRRLVRLSPRLMAWTNTHVDGPYRYSQYWYRIRGDSARISHLEFEGLRLETSSRNPTQAEMTRQAAARRRSDSEEWRLRLAPALERELRGSGRSKT